MIVTSDSLEIGKDLLHDEINSKIRNYPGPINDALADMRMYIDGASFNAESEDDRLALYLIFKACIVGFSYLATNGIVTEDPRK